MNGRGIVPPALLTTTSMRPNSAIVCATMSSMRVVLVHVARDHERAPAEAAHLVGDRVELFLGAGREHDVGAGLGVGLRGLRADAAPGAGDDRDLAGERERVCSDVIRGTG